MYTISVHDTCLLASTDKKSATGKDTADMDMGWIHQWGWVASVIWVRNFHVYSWVKKRSHVLRNCNAFRSGGLGQATLLLLWVKLGLNQDGLDWVFKNGPKFMS